MQHVLQEKPGADQDDAELEPELIGGYAGAKDLGNVERVRDDQADNDGPEDIFNLRQAKVVLGAKNSENVFQQLPSRPIPNRSITPGSTDIKPTGGKGPAPAEETAESEELWAAMGIGMVCVDIVRHRRLLRTGPAGAEI